MNRIIIAATLSLFCLAANAQSYLVDKVIAKVGSEYILLSEVEDQFAYASTQTPGLAEDAKCEILENLIAQRLIVYQAKLDSVEVSDEELEAQLDFRFQNILRQMNGDEEVFKEYYGYTVAEMKEKYRDDQKQQILAERMQSTLINSVKITPEEVRDFFHSIPTDSLPYLNSQVELGEIVIVPEVNEEQKEIARKKLQGFRDQIVSGEATLGELARKYSMDPGSGARGGDLGYAERGTYVPEFEATVYTLKERELSEVIETEYGFHIIELMNRRGNRVRAKHILISPDLTESDFAKARNRLDSVRTLIVNDSISFSKAVKRFSEEETQSYNNDGRMVNPATGEYLFEADQLEPDVYLEIIDLEEGEITNVIEAKDPRGAIQYKIIQLQSLVKPHQVSLEQDYDKISQFAKENKKASYFNEWIADKINDTFIEVKGDFGQCPNIIEMQM